MPKEPASEIQETQKPAKTYVERAEISLKGVSRFLKRDGADSAEQRAMLQLQHANVLALLELAAAIRHHGGSGD